MVRKNALPIPADHPAMSAEPASTKVTGRWGTSEAKWLMDREDAEIVLHLREGIDLIGFLVGVDNYSVFIERESDKKVLFIPKHAINYGEGV